MKDKNELTKRQKKSIKTKNAIYNSAVKLFVEKGYNNVTIDEVVGLAGTSKGSFYTHFQSKDQVIVEQLRDYDNYYLELFDKIDKLNTAEHKLTLFARSFYQYTKLKVGIDVIKVMYETQIFHKKEDKYVISEERPLYKIINQISKEGQDSGEFTDTISSEELAKLIIRCMRGTLYDWCLLDDSNYDLVKDGTNYMSLFISGIKKKTVE